MLNFENSLLISNSLTPLFRILMSSLSILPCETFESKFPYLLIAKNKDSSISKSYTRENLIALNILNGSSIILFLLSPIVLIKQPYKSLTPLEKWVFR